MAAAGGKDMTATEVCLLHHVSYPERIGEAAQLLRNASGLYDTAARAAASR
jgi:predicted MarR family transcription regulator